MRRLRSHPASSSGIAPALRDGAMSMFWLLALLTVVAACGARGKSAFEIAVRAESDPGKPLAGVRFAFGGAELGQSDASGRARLVMSGNPGDVVELTVNCPAGHRAPEEPLSVVLRTLAEPRRVPEYRALCAPTLRSLVIAVRAERGPNLPLTYLGREIARTDGEGAAHAVLEVEPNQPVSVVLDTSAAAQLRPQNPELKLVMPARDELALFEQTFTVAAADKPRAKRPPPVLGPTRLTTAR